MTANFHVDVKEGGGGRSDLNVQWTLISGAEGNMLMAPKYENKLQSN